MKLKAQHIHFPALLCKVRRGLIKETELLEVTTDNRSHLPCLVSHPHLLSLPAALSLTLHRFEIMKALLIIFVLVDNLCLLAPQKECIMPSKQPSC